MKNSADIVMDASALHSELYLPILITVDKS